MPSAREKDHCRGTLQLYVGITLCEFNISSVYHPRRRYPRSLWEAISLVFQGTQRRKSLLHGERNPQMQKSPLKSGLLAVGTDPQYSQGITDGLPNCMSSVSPRSAVRTVCRRTM